MKSSPVAKGGRVVGVVTFTFTTNSHPFPIKILFEDKFCGLLLLFDSWLFRSSSSCNELYIFVTKIYICLVRQILTEIIIWFVMPIFTSDGFY